MSKTRFSTTLFIFCVFQFIIWSDAYPDPTPAVRQFISSTNNAFGEQDASYTPVHAPNTCAMRGNPPGDFMAPYVYNGPSLPGDKPFPVCKQFQDNGCCTYSQMNTLTVNIQLINPLFGACPACLNNFIEFWCNLYCHPNQSMFTNVVKVDNATQENSADIVVNKAVYQFDTKFSQKIFDSCKDVKFGATGQPVMKLIMGSKTPDEWFHFLANNAPYSMDFKYDKTSKDGAFHFDTRSCADSCSCSDCSASCPTPQPPPPPYKCEIIHIPCHTFGLLCGFIVGAAAIILLSLGAYQCTNLCYRQRTEPTNKHDDSYGALTYKSCFQRLFFHLGHTCAKRPVITLIITFVLVLGASAGIVTLKIETTPERLWVSPGSPLATQKRYFDQTFGGFYRTNQIIMTPKVGHKALRKDILLELHTLEMKLRAIEAKYKGRIVRQTDMCFRPIRGHGCMVQTPLEYWQMDRTKIEQATQKELEEHVIFCSGHPVDPDCRSSIGAFSDPHVVLGGFEGNNYANATALVVTYLLDNEEKTNPLAEAWEKEWIKIVGTKHQSFDAHYMAKRSVQDELARGSGVDIPTVIISYCAMFVYVAFALGRFFKVPFKQIFVRSRFILGLGGIIMVILSVSSSAGICALCGVHATLIISEVIPFLILAIGVDNIFILVNKYEQSSEHLPVPARVGHALAQSGSSICLAASCEALAFLLGALTKMPAVQAFALYAGVAVIIDFLLQITMFPAMLCIDGKRIAARRVDCCLPCIRVAPNGEPDEAFFADGTPDPAPNAQPGINVDERTPLSATTYSDPAAPIAPKKPLRRPLPPGLLRTLMQKYFAPFVLCKYVKMCVMVLFLGFALLCANQIPYMKQGLSQSKVLPKDSYVVDYFHYQGTALRVGPPVYFVVKNFNYTTRLNQNQICGLGKGEGGCKPNSLVNKVSIAGLTPKQSYMYGTVNSWLDSYLTWLRSGSCCRYHPGAVKTFCPPDEDDDADCVQCVPQSELDHWGRPSPDAFNEYLAWFLQKSECGPACAVCGMPFQKEVVLGKDNRTIIASRFRSSHTVLSAQSDYINTLKSGIEISKQLHKEDKLDVFPYSIHYIFFEQYLSIIGLTLQNMGLATAAVMIMTFILTRNLRATLIIVLVLSLIEIDLLGIMSMWSISLNAVSVVNIVMGIGIAVEFCVHITHAFLYADGKTRDERVAHALADMGASVFSGITLTKAIGVFVLAFAQSQVFVVYYFRMFFSIVVLAALHGFLLLPVLLSIVGPKTAPIVEDTNPEYHGPSLTDTPQASAPVPYSGASLGQSPDPRSFV